MVENNRPVLVIGAGPGGLLAGASLKKRGIPFQIVDAGRQAGGIWDIDRDETPMYESAHFISSRTLSGFPDFPMPETYADYPRHDRILEYIRAFARHHSLEEHITFGVTVLAAEPLAEGGWTVRLDSGEVRHASALVVAAGMTWYPRTPTQAKDFDGESYHSFHYRSPSEFAGKRVVIVGGGNSAADIACDAARAAKQTFISLRRGYHFIPKFIFGQPADVFAHAGPKLPMWLEERVFGFLVNRILVGDLRRYGLPRPDHPILRSHPILNTQVLHHLGHGDIQAKPDVRTIEGKRIHFVDGTSEEVDLVLWATGYERRFPFLNGVDVGEDGEAPDLYLNVFHRERPDLFFMGLFETDGAAYGLYASQAELVGRYLDPSSEGMRVTFDARRTGHRPDLTGGRRYVSSPRHAHYVKGDSYQKALAAAARELGS